MFQSLRALPVSLFGAVMGLAGLGLALRSASTILPIKSPLPEIPIAAALLVLVILLAAYVARLLRHPDAVIEEFTNPALVGFCATLPVGCALVSAGVKPYSADLALLLWWCAAPLLIAYQLWTLGRFFGGGLQLAQVNGGWLIVFVGGIVMPYAGLPLGYEGLSAYFFGASAVAAPFVMAAILYRLLFGPALPDALRPSWFILLVPPALIYTNGTALWQGPGSALLEWLFYAALPLAAALIISARGFWRWPFGAPWWAFTFPLDALAVAALHFAKDHPEGPWRAFAGFALLLALAAVVTVLLRTLAALARGRLPPRSAGNGS